VTGECGTSNLHSAWDTCLVTKAVGVRDSSRRSRPRCCRSRARW
jgi:hypothetical protein